jgi:hypothetical protein
MNRTPLVSLALAALFGVAGPQVSYAQDQPSKGKIDDVERSAENAKGDHDHGHEHDGDHDDDGFGPGFFVRVLFWVPRDTGQGYLDYPYQASGRPATFVRRRVWEGRSFGTFTASYFSDAGSTLRGGQFALQWAGGAFERQLDYTFYREPLATHTDYLHLLRFGVAGLPPLGDVGYLRIGLGVQAVILDHGAAAAGPQLELGAQLFPAPPLGLGATLRLAPLTWEGGPLFGTGFADLMGHGSVFLGPAELMVGWRWTRVGVGAPFSGPTAGMKVWF